MQSVPEVRGLNLYLLLGNQTCVAQCDELTPRDDMSSIRYTATNSKLTRDGIKSFAGILHNGNRYSKYKLFSKVHLLIKKCYK